MIIMSMPLEVSVVFLHFSLTHLHQLKVQEDLCQDDEDAAWSDRRDASKTSDRRGE